MFGARATIRFERLQGFDPFGELRRNFAQTDARSDRRGAAADAGAEAEVIVEPRVDADQNAPGATCNYGDIRVVTRTNGLHRRRTRSL